eukprot:scaffold70579_cov18-Tisochrysis_lutea.AAC.1
MSCHVRCACAAACELGELKLPFTTTQDGKCIENCRKYYGTCRCEQSWSKLGEGGRSKQAWPVHNMNAGIKKVVLVQQP